MILGNTETPVLFVIAGPVGNSLGHVGKAEETGIELLKGHPATERHRITNKMEVILAKIENTIACGRHHIGLANNPFLGNHPVKTTRAAGNLGPLQRHDLAQNVMAGAHALTGDAARQRPQAVEIGGHLIGSFKDPVGLFFPYLNHHAQCLSAGNFRVRFVSIVDLKFI